MLWIVVILILLVIVMAKATSSRERKSLVISPSPVSQKRYVERDGKEQEADSVFDAWTFGDFETMLEQLNQNTTLVDRHFLLMNIVDQAYTKRDDKKMRTICHQVAQTHISEFPKIKPALKKSLGGVTPRVSTFQQYATVLTEDGLYSEAVAVCEAAKKYGLSDGTKGNFQGRIERIKKKESMSKKLKKSEQSGVDDLGYSGTIEK